ncbi:MAG: hypothetical protein ACMUIL_12665, partial [bacterium]
MPKAELVIFPDTKGQFYLAWKVAYSDNVQGSWVYYIDARTGTIIDRFDNLIHFSVDGTVRGNILLFNASDPSNTVSMGLRDSLVYADYRVTHQDCYRVCLRTRWVCCPWHIVCAAWETRCHPPTYSWYTSDIEETSSDGSYSNLSFEDSDRYRLRFDLDGSITRVINSKNGLYSRTVEKDTVDDPFDFVFYENPDDPYSLFDSVNVFYHVTDTLDNYYEDELDFELGYKII